MKSNIIPLSHPELVSGSCNAENKMLEQSSNGMAQHETSSWHKILNRVQDDTLVLMIVFCVSNSALNAHPSLFFTDEEITHIRDKQQGPLRSGKLSLSAILFHDKNQWSIWINDKVIHPENVHELGGFQIENVTPTSVQFSKLAPDGSIAETFTLHPYEGEE